MSNTSATPRQPGADLAVSLIRTWVPIGVGAILGWIAESRHVIVPAGASATAGTLAAGMCAAGYYALARLLEHSPGAGALTIAGRTLGRIMLGGLSAPHYPPVS